MPGGAQQKWNMAQEANRTNLLAQHFAGMDAGSPVDVAMLQSHMPAGTQLPEGVTAQDAVGVIRARPFIETLASQDSYMAENPLPNFNDWVQSEHGVEAGEGARWQYLPGYLEHKANIYANSPHGMLEQSGFVRPGREFMPGGERNPYIGVSQVLAERAGQKMSVVPTGTGAFRLVASGDPAPAEAAAPQTPSEFAESVVEGLRPFHEPIAGRHV